MKTIPTNTEVFKESIKKLSDICMSVKNPISKDMERFLESLFTLGGYEYTIEEEPIKPFSFFEENWQDSQFFTWNAESLPRDNFKSSQKFIGITFDYFQKKAQIYIHIPTFQPQRR